MYYSQISDYWTLQLTVTSKQQTHLFAPAKPRSEPQKNFVNSGQSISKHSN